jgi:hypothetical protein
MPLEIVLNVWARIRAMQFAQMGLCQYLEIHIVLWLLKHWGWYGTVQNSKIGVQSKDPKGVSDIIGGVAMSTTMISAMVVHKMGTTKDYVSGHIPLGRWEVQVAHLGISQSLKIQFAKMLLNHLGGVWKKIPFPIGAHSTDQKGVSNISMARSTTTSVLAQAV